jgi:hypothetical protein
MAVIKFSDVSKRVGWTHKNVGLPTKARMDYIEKNLNPESFDLMVEILEYNRFCKSGVPDPDCVMKRVVELLSKIGKMTY